MNFRTVNALTRDMYPQYPHDGLKGHALFPMLAALCIVFLGAKRKDFQSRKPKPAHERSLEAAIKVAKKLNSIDESEAFKMVADHNGCSAKKLVKKLKKGVAATGRTGVSC
jgi:hypothetical protein